ncbi:MAG: alpha-N-arabinofuranosidase [Actinobacteria bacterium]|nr:alpha-N-arabinofuranosidase [Actinomycetota bacterium]
MHTAHLALTPSAVIGPINPRLYGSFLEHLGRAVYDGIHEPQHPTADADGFRTDVIELVKELGVTGVRYPGGNFVSGFQWEDSVGPREDRPRRLDLAWHSTETNQVGLHEFQAWLDAVGSELVLAVNLGTRGVAEALALLEYANHRAGTARAEQRIANGRTEPFGIRMWCLGNEMDGPWQVGHRTAEDYGTLAARTAQAMKMVDPDLELVVCGSSSSSMPTFGEWERVVLSHTYEDVEFISCHAYYENTGDLGAFLASGVDMDRFIESVVSTADHVKAVRSSDRTINISFDEWNVWYATRFENVDKITGVDNWPVAPRLLEDTYTVADAVVFGSLLISLLKHADRVTSASLAQLVNVIAPIMTEPGGPAWKQATFFPFAATSAHGRGVALAADVACETYRTERFGEVPLVDAVVTHDEAAGRYAVFAVNRATDGPTEFVLDLAALGTVAAGARLGVRVLADDDLDAANTLDHPDRVVLADLPYRREGDAVRVELPPVSWVEILVELPD